MSNFELLSDRGNRVLSVTLLSKRQVNGSAQDSQCLHGLFPALFVCGVIRDGRHADAKMTIRFQVSSAFLYTCI